MCGVCLFISPAHICQGYIATCLRFGLDPARAALVRIGSNAVYRLREPAIRVEYVVYRGCCPSAR